MVTIFLVAALNFVVHFVGTVAYSPRLTGVLSGRLSLSTSLSNILSIVSRSAAVLMIPLLSKKIESSLASSNQPQAVPDHYLYIFLLALIGSLVGLFFLEKIVKLLFYTVSSYSTGANILGLLFRESLSLNRREDLVLISQRPVLKRTDYYYLALNVLITCIYTSATLAAVYSSYLVSQYRVTALSCAFVINGIGTFVFVTMIDPYISSYTDAALKDKGTFPEFYFRIRSFIYSRIAGVILSFLTFHFFLFAITQCIKLIN